MRTFQLLVRFSPQVAHGAFLDSLQSDWIQDSLRERYARVLAPPKANSLTARLSRLKGPVGYVGRTVARILEEGETWVVLSLVGELARSYPTRLDHS
jgi:hypothetical protein